MRFSLPLLAIAAFSLLPACAGSHAGSDDPSEDALHGSSGSPVKISDDDANKTISVAKGKDLSLSLSANPTTGFSWKVVSTNRTFGYPTPKDGSFEGAGSDGPVGSGGHQVFVWKTNTPVLEAGSTLHSVTLEYRRSFESDDRPAAKTFKFKVKITRGAGTETPDDPSTPSYECPTQHSINCMPPVDDSRQTLCNSDFRRWAQQNCDVSYLD